jgi:hypothetical protein
MNPKATTPLTAALIDKDPQILQTLLSIYSDRLLHHSGQLWAIGSVLIPLSLSGIAFGLNSPIQTLFIGAFSITLIWIWYVFTVNIRKLIDQTYKICGSIESTLLDLDPPLVKTGLEELNPEKGHNHLKTIRLFIPIIVTFGWLVVIILSFIIK